MRCIGEWLLLCSQLQLIDDEFTAREATLAFMWSKMHVANVSEASERRQLLHLGFEDFMEALVRIATMKCLPTDDEVAISGFDDAGQMLLAMSAIPANYAAFRAARPTRWNEPLRQPIWRAVHHLICLMVRSVGHQVHGCYMLGDLKLTRREVATFKKRWQNAGGGSDGLAK